MVCWPVDIFEEFKVMFNEEQRWQMMANFINERERDRIRMVLSLKKVEGRVRRVVKVRRPPLS